MFWKLKTKLKPFARWLGQKTGYTFRKETLENHRPGGTRFEDNLGKDGFTAKWTPKGRKVLLANPLLVELFKHVRDNYPLPEQVPEKFSYKRAVVERKATRKEGTPADKDTRHAIYQITLPGGRKFAFKDGIAATAMDGFEIETAYRARKSGINTIDHYAQIMPHNSNRYFMLMPWVELPTFEKFHDQTPQMIEEFTRQQTKLYELGILDSEDYNCFVETKGKKFNFKWFDLRKG